MTPKTNECHDLQQATTSKTAESPRKKLFKTAHGYVTSRVRSDYIMARGLNNDDHDDIPTSLDADVSSPLLYPWQVYSLLGAEPIHDLITNFYHRVYDDDTEDGSSSKFREAFAQLAPIEHHIMAQTRFWIDAMGGGRLYHGGDGRLNWHHEYNAHSVMNAVGAKRWMHHMRLALMDVAKDWNSVDPRIIPCVMEFLKVKMQKYADRHGWEFDDSDFYLIDESPLANHVNNTTGAY